VPSTTRPLLALLALGGCATGSQDAAELAAGVDLTRSLQLLVPLYQYPDPGATTYRWDDVAAAAARVPVVAIVNPHSGPGNGPPDENYQAAMRELRDAGVPMLGYVYTRYGERPLPEVLGDIDLYRQHFELAGIFVDEAASAASALPYYRALQQRIEAGFGAAALVVNSRSDADEAYLREPVCDVAVIFEDTGAVWQRRPPDTAAVQPADSRSAVLIHSVPGAAEMRRLVTEAAVRGVEYVYVTDDQLDGGDGNPWNGVPSYLGAEVDFVEYLNETRLAPR
jgi:hypothetical protein